MLPAPSLDPRVPIIFPIALTTHVGHIMTIFCLTLRPPTEWKYISNSHFFRFFLKIQIFRLVEKTGFLEERDENKINIKEWLAVLFSGENVGFFYQIEPIKWQQYRTHFLGKKVPQNYCFQPS